MRGDWRLVGDELYNLKTDWGQRRNIATKYPEIAASMAAEYEKWWHSISGRFDEFCPIAINPAKQKVTKICAMELMGPMVAYNQRHVRAAQPIEDAFSMIDVEVPGPYRISLRR